MRVLAIARALAIMTLPRGLGRIVAGRLPVIQGRRIDLEAFAVGELAQALSRRDPTPEQSRADLARGAARFDAPCPAMVSRHDTTLPGGDGPRSARLYTPPGRAEAPVLLYLHGGGWVQGDLETHDGLCGRLALWSGLRVVSLDYRLAPEHPFPAAPDDVLAAYRALLENWGLDPRRIAVGGDSAGGNLTAVLMHDLAEAGLPLPRAQLLLYPALDARLDTPSMRALRVAYILPRERIEWFLDHYLPEGQDRMAPRFSAAFSPHLAGQPDALVLVAGQDPLRDEGIAHAEALRAAGGTVELVEYPGQIHAFLNMSRIMPHTDEAVRKCAEWLRRVMD